ncbi:MAG: dependent oxidoreductase [Candidatus Solibacter sp.]|nr:dependent oxidoreductase [Candidatus Solibacter sp.]
MTALSRRGFLGVSTLGLAGCAARRVPLGTAPGVNGAPHLARVRVAPERVIRTIVGLRPYRPGGFVVGAQKLDTKTVIHNYGHGGAGITLSWGTAQLAADEARSTGAGARECAVLGCGVVGLSTARVLQERGYTPTIYAREMPPATTSNVAGGLWEPVSLFDLPRVTPAFRRQFAEAARIAFRRYQSLAGEQYAVRWRALYSLGTEHAHTAPSADNPMSDVESLYPEARQLQTGEHPFDVPFAYRRQTMVIEPAIYLAALIRDFQSAGGKIVIRDFASAADLMGLKEGLLFNCTGLGARALFGDEELTPIRGQLVFLLPQPEVDYCTLGPGGTYMFPRQDGIVLGGSFDRGEWNLDPDPAITERILRENGVLFREMKG